MSGPEDEASAGDEPTERVVLRKDDPDEPPAPAPPWASPGGGGSGPGTGPGPGPGEAPPSYAPPAYGPPPGYGPPPAYEPPGPSGPGYGYGGPPAYGPPPYGPPPGYPPPMYAPARPTNGSATVAFVLGLLSIAVCPLLGVPALFVGSSARRQAAARNEEGSGLALAGMIMGGVSTVITVVVVAIWVVFGVLAATLVTTADPYSGRPPGTFSPGFTTTTRGSATTSRPGPRSSALPPSTCARLRLALADLAHPEVSTADRLNASARSLQADLGPEHVPDVTAVLVDGISRVGQRGAAPRPPEIVAASNRLTGAVDAACPV